MKREGIRILATSISPTPRKKSAVRPAYLEQARADKPHPSRLVDRELAEDEPENVVGKVQKGELE
jgi:hypothetical protein